MAESCHTVHLLVLPKYSHRSKHLLGNMVIGIGYGRYQEIQALVIILQGLSRLLPASVSVYVARGEREDGVTKGGVVQSSTRYVGLKVTPSIGDVSLFSPSEPFLTETNHRDRVILPIVPYYQ